MSYTQASLDKGSFGETRVELKARAYTLNEVTLRSHFKSLTKQANNSIVAVGLKSLLLTTIAKVASVVTAVLGSFSQQSPSPVPVSHSTPRLLPSQAQLDFAQVNYTKPPPRQPLLFAAL